MPNLLAAFRKEAEGIADPDYSEGRYTIYPFTRKDIIELVSSDRVRGTYAKVIAAI